MIQTSADGRIMLLQGRDSTYAVGVTRDGRWVTLFWGSRIDVDDVPLPESAAHRALLGQDDEEFPGWSGLQYHEPALKVTFPDGVRDVWLRYQAHHIADDVLNVTLADDAYGVTAHLTYRVHEPWDLVERSVVLENCGPAAVRVEQALTGAAHIPWQVSYRLTHLAGRWGEETQRQRQEVPLGSIVLESRRGHTSHHQNPWVAIDSGHADESQGEVWYAALAWSGNWKLVIERDAPGHLRFAAGVHNFDLEYRLDPGEQWALPPLVLGYSRAGFGHASRQLHAYQREEVLPRRFAHVVRPVIYNSWYATEFAIDDENQRQLAARAASIGVELFVIDDGWFDHRHDDHRGLGDWWVSPEKFPRGLAPLIAHVRSLGMEFGIWVEPEMVNPDSDLYRAHPDWVYHFPGRPRSEMRNQLVLNLARPDVETFIVETLDNLLSQNDIRFVKWDMNRSWSEPGWPDAPPGRAREVWVRHIQALYRILSTVRQRHPDVLIENCAGGGGRVDMGILRYTDQVWTSDNVFAQDRLKIQEGFSYVYAPKVQVAWVTDNRGGRMAPLRYRFHVAMQGTLGIGGNLLYWSEADMSEAQHWIVAYKEVRPIIQHGRLYRLLSPCDGGDAAVWYTDQEGREGVALVYRTSAPPWAPPIRLQLPGLQNGRYTVHYPDGTTQTHSAAGLISIGVVIPLVGDFVSALVRIRPLP